LKLFLRRKEYDAYLSNLADYLFGSINEDRKIKNKKMYQYILVQMKLIRSTTGMAEWIDKKSFFRVSK